MHDLADVVEAKWKLALAVVMGRDFDAVVVDTGAACRIPAGVERWGAAVGEV